MNLVHFQFNIDISRSFPLLTALIEELKWFSKNLVNYEIYYISNNFTVRFKLIRIVFRTIELPLEETELNVAL